MNKRLELSDRGTKASISKMLKAVTSSFKTNEKVQNLKKKLNQKLKWKLQNRKIEEI